MRLQTISQKLKRSCSAVVLGGLALFAAPETAQAQEILLTGPLAGAPAVRKQRLYREQRWELSPVVGFTLLDEYQRTILLGARANYAFTDWLAVGAYAAWGGLRFTTHLTDETQAVNEERRRQAAAGDEAAARSLGLTSVNMGPSLEDQLGGMDWLLAPQLTGVPFRGKLALFSNIYLDTDLYFFAGPAIVGVSERADCAAGTCGTSYKTASRIAVAPTFGLGFTFFVNEWNAVGLEWRGLPFPINTAGFDTRGQGEDERFPDNAIDDKDRVFRFNQMITLSYNFYFPRMYRVSE